MKRVCSNLVVAVGLAAAANSAAAGTISFSGEQAETGKGVGSVLTLILFSPDPQASTYEWGAVAWDGTDDVVTGSKITGGSNNATRTVLEIKDGGWVAGDDVIVVLNLDQGGSEPNDLTIYDFTVTAWDDAGGFLDSWTYTPPSGGKVLDPEDSGIGSSGFLFRLVGLGSVMDTDTNRFGISIPEARPFDKSPLSGHETFYISSAAALPVSVPLPPAAAAGLGLLGAIGAIGAFRRRRSVR